MFEEQKRDIIQPRDLGMYIPSIHQHFTPKKENRKEKIRDKNETQREEYIFVKRLIICKGRNERGRRVN